MEALRTPDSRFARLSAYPYQVRRAPVGDDLEAAYLAEGPHDGRPVLLLHGGASWSYLWRRVAPMLIEAGCRVIAPDLIGFGASDKPSRARELGLERQLGWLRALCEHVDVQGATLVFHGLSGLLGLRLLGEAGARFNAAAGVCAVFDRSAPEVAELCRCLSEDGERPVADLVAMGCVEPLTAAARTAYDAPFPDREHMRAVRALPELLAEPGEDWPARIGPVAVPLLAVAGSADHIAGTECAWLDRLGRPEGAERLVRRRVVLPGAGHLAPEDRGAELALALLSFLARL